MEFVHRFSRSASCEMTVGVEPPSKGKNHIQKLKWIGQPQLKHLRECVRWSHAIHEHLAKLWNLRLMQIVQFGPELWEVWAYEPGKPAKLLEKL